MAECSSSQSRKPPKPPGRPRKKPKLPSLETLEVAVEGVRASTWAVRADTLVGLDPICSLQVPNRLLVAWHERRSYSGDSYVSQLNKAIPHQAIVVAEGSRLEGNLSCKAGTTVSKVKAVKGRARVAGSIYIALCAGDIVNLLQEVELLEGKVEDIALEMRGKESTVKALNEEIARLATTDQLRNAGRPIEEVGERQQRRKLSQFKSSVEKLLWFATSFWAGDCFLDHPYLTE